MPAPKNAPLYQQIYDEIKDAIEKGVYAPKERIPSELELAEQYDVSRITVRRAVEELCSDGYLVKQQGRGTFVSTPHINRQFHASTLQTFTALCAGNGMKAGAHVIDRQIVPARQNEMEFFGLQKDALLLHIKRVRTADGEPIFEENIFVPFDAYRELLTADLEDKSIFAEVERVGGIADCLGWLPHGRGRSCQYRAGGRVGHCSARSAAQPACQLYRSQWRAGPDG